MNGEDNGEHSGEGIDGAEEARQYFGGIDVRGAVECEDSELAPAVAVEEAEFGADAGFLGERKELAQRVDHHVSDEINTLPRAAFLEQMFDGIFFCNKEIAGDGVRQEAVDFFGHCAVEAPQAGLDMGDRNAQFDGGERHGDRGIHVANHQHKVGLAIEEDRLDTAENFRGLRGVRTGANLEIDVRRGDLHLAKEDVGEFFVVMLAGVNEEDRKSTRLNSSHVAISYAVFCLKKKKIYEGMPASSTLKRNAQIQLSTNLDR